MSKLHKKSRKSKRGGTKESKLTKGISAKFTQYESGQTENELAIIREDMRKLKASVISDSTSNNRKETNLSSFIINCCMTYPLLF
jgi:hypothetical protein